MAIVNFFLGSMASDGFFSLFKYAAQPPAKSFLLKGTPGSGKSTIMKKVHIYFNESNKVTEHIHCAQNPETLDGIVYPEQQVAVLDATAPHSFEPIYPVIAGTEMNLYDCINSNKVYPCQEKVIEIVDKIAFSSVRCKNFLNAMSSLTEENRNLALEYTDIERIHSLALNLSSKELPNQSRKPKEHKRMLSAITPQGMFSYEDTIHTLCDKIYVIKDEFTCSSSILLSRLRMHALESGQEFYTCYYPIEATNRIEHLIFPKLGIAFVTSHRYNDFSFKPHRTINFVRFTDMTALKRYKQRLSFHRKAADGLFSEAVQHIRFQKEQYDLLKEIYINAADFTCVDIIASKLINNLAGIL